MIQFNHVSKYFAGKAAVSDLSLHIVAGEFTVLAGRSGSGKSTTLKLINRLAEYDGGSIYFAGQEIRQCNPQQLRRRIGYTIQSAGLFPHWTVEKNIATVPALLSWPAAKIQQRVSELLSLLGLEEAFRQRYPHQLSGGQQQRVGVARALAADPEVLLMDEPFGALDPVTRSALQQEMIRIHQHARRTIVLVTHDVDEALMLADKIVLMDDGCVVQQGDPLTLLTQPVNEFVHNFFGQCDWGIRLLSLSSAGSMARQGEWLDKEPVAAEMTLRAALTQFIRRQTDKLPVLGKQGQPLGVLHFCDLLQQQEKIK